MPPTSLNSQPQQKGKTIQYWNDFYSGLDESVQELRQSRHQSLAIPKTTLQCSDRQTTDRESYLDVEHERIYSSELEWIAPNSPPLLDMVLDAFPGHSKIVQRDSDLRIRVIEIGCGVSQLSRSLLEHAIKRREMSHPRTSSFYSFVASDVSSVCLERNLARDAPFISSLQATKSSPAGDSLSYEALDILRGITNNGGSQSLGGKFHVCLDKGTLDTFLFRSKRIKKGTSPHPPLLIPLLNNVHQILMNGCNSKYIIISPRSKIKSVRDFKGFASVKRRILRSNLVGDLFLLEANDKKNTDMGDGKGNINKSKKSSSNVYMYECTRNDFYKPGIDCPFRDAGAPADDESFCMTCGVTFREFRGNVEIFNQGEVCWARRWRGHCIHCRGAE
ncbi:hypothetical protein ACHAXS_007233 [Conticribra weissflogii]